MINGQNAQVL